MCPRSAGASLALERGMNHILVVYFSRTGTTAQVARSLASALGADLDIIVERRSRDGLRGYFRSAYEATRRILPDIANPARDPGDYDLVIIGSPTWNASVASPVRTYLHRYAQRMHEVAFFCTCGGRGGDRVLAQMTQLVHKEPLATMVVREREVESGAAEHKVSSFAARFRRASEAA